MKKNNRKYGVALLALALANFNLSAQDGGDGATSELNPLNVIGSKIEAPLSTGLKSSLPANKVPQSLSIVSDKQIKAPGLKSLMSCNIMLSMSKNAVCTMMWCLSLLVFKHAYMCL